jgi:hypothetical protein
MLLRMTQSTVQAWSERIQAKLMAKIDALWAAIEATDDPAVIRKARDKVRLCGELAAAARKVAAMTGLKKATPAGGSFGTLVEAASAPEPRGLDRLKSGRGRL